MKKTPDEIKKGLNACANELNCNSCPYKGFRCTRLLMQDAAEALRQLEAKVPRWISVEERLPEYGRYLVITQKGDGKTKVQTATYNNMGWWMYANFGEVTHWMPLPEPPVEE